VLWQPLHSLSLPLQLIIELIAAGLLEVVEDRFECVEEIIVVKDSIIA
jgi:hypothetical protein